MCFHNTKIIGIKTILLIMMLTEVFECQTTNVQ